MNKLAGSKSGVPPALSAVAGFDEIVQLITTARQRAYQAVNTTLIDLYWHIGERISQRIAAAEWGDGVVEQLARYIAKTQPNAQGFTRPNLFRMRQFYEAYRDDAKVFHWRDNCPGRTTSSS